MSRPTELYIKIPQWVFQALIDGEITADQFDILVFCYGKRDWNANWVRSYCAESVCRFRRLDATEANLKRYRRAKLDLKNRRIIWDDYRKGVETPYTLYLPAFDPFAHRPCLESLSDSALSVLFVRANVLADDAASDAASMLSEPCGENMSVPISVQNDGVMSIKDHTAVKTAQLGEREPLNPQGDFSPSAPSRGNAQPAGANDDKPPQRKTLSSRQCDELNILVDAFASAWAKFHRGFTCDQSDLKKLLREFSPLETLIAYRGMTVDDTGKFKDFASSRQAAFFDRSAKAAIRTNRQNHVQFCLKGRPDLFEDELPKVYELEEKWCAIFECPLPLVYWDDYKYPDIHFYHPRLRDVLDPWKTALDAADQRAEAARKANEKAAAEKKRKEEVELEQAKSNWMRDARAHTKDDDQGLGWLASNILNVPKEWAIPEHFYAELNRLRNAEKDRRELAPAIRLIERETRDCAESVWKILCYGETEGISEDQIRKAALLMGLQEQKPDRQWNEPWWKALATNYKSPIAEVKS